MDSTNPAAAVPQVSVIIPARNEEANLERCLRSLVVQKGVSFEILIVDDASTDRTRTIAESFTRVRQCPFIATQSSFSSTSTCSTPRSLCRRDGPAKPTPSLPANPLRSASGCFLPTPIPSISKALWPPP